jgi:hypothetical protein
MLKFKEESSEAPINSLVSRLGETPGPWAAPGAGIRIRVVNNKTEQSLVPPLTTRLDDASNPLKLDPGMEAFFDRRSSHCGDLKNEQRQARSNRINIDERIR